MRRHNSRMKFKLSARNFRGTNCRLEGKVERGGIIVGWASNGVLEVSEGTIVGLEEKIKVGGWLLELEVSLKYSSPTSGIHIVDKLQLSGTWSNSLTLWET